MLNLVKGLNGLNRCWSEVVNGEQLKLTLNLFYATLVPWICTSCHFNNGAVPRCKTII